MRTKMALFIGGLVCGAVCGVGTIYFMGYAERTSEQPAAPPDSKPGKLAGTPEAELEAALLRCTAELAELRGTVESLSPRGVQQRTVPPTPQLPSVDQSAGSSNLSSDTVAREQALSWRVSAIEKFVPLSDAQRERLRRSFQLQSEGGDGAAEAETLEQVIGEENARFYRQQVANAFRKYQDEQVERDVVWLTRQLGLSSQQERDVQGVFASIEEELSGGGHPGGGRGGSTTSVTGFSAVVSESRRRSELRAERLKPVLTPEQYQAYLRQEAESSSADVQVFHGQ